MAWNYYYVRGLSHVLMIPYSCKCVADGRKCIISILSYPEGCQDVGYGDDRGSTMPDI